MQRALSLPYNKDIVNNSRAAAMIGVSFFVIAMALGAYIRIPVPGSPVPITLQTLFVMLSGAVLGKRLGRLSQAGYLMLGALGLPVFQGFSFGISHILGPTGGYLAGFIAASYMIGLMVDRRKVDIPRIAISFIAGNIILYTLGVAWLMVLYKINLPSAISIGVLPFIPGEILKTSLAVVIFSRISKRSKEIFYR